MRLLHGNAAVQSSDHHRQSCSSSKRIFKLLRHSLDKRIGILVEIALTHDSDRSRTIERQEKAARHLGVTGAEMDAARAGRSFDVKSGAAVRLALAVQSQNRSAITAARERASQVGLNESDLAAIERLTAKIQRCVSPATQR